MLVEQPDERFRRCRWLIGFRLETVVGLRQHHINGKGREGDRLPLTVRTHAVQEDVPTVRNLLIAGPIHGRFDVVPGLLVAILRP